MISQHCRLIVWGHSLGAAVACRTLFSLETAEDRMELVDTLVLESPFNNLHDEVRWRLAQPSEGPLRRLGGRILPVATVLRLTDMQFRCG